MRVLYLIFQWSSLVNELPKTVIIIEISFDIIDSNTKKSGNLDLILINSWWSCQSCYTFEDWYTSIDLDLNFYNFGS